LQVIFGYYQLILPIIFGCIIYLQGGDVVRAQHDQADGEAGRLARHRVVFVQVALQLFVDVLASGAHGG